MKIYEKPIKGLTLARYGGMNLVKQKNNYGRDTYHSAPERYGCYAFIYPYIELFLAYSTKEREIKAGVYKKFTPKGGLIWTHLTPPKRSMVVEESESWFKVRVSDMPKVCGKAFAEEVGHQFAQSKYGYFELRKGNRDDPRFTPMNKAPYASISKDHLEVFVCRDTIF